LFDERIALQLQAIGTSLAGACGMRGLFGLDFILRDSVPLIVEINPRYTASVEVLEHALGLSVLGLHRQVFQPEVAMTTNIPRSTGGIIGKAILFARENLVFPGKGPWQATLGNSGPATTLPNYADIPSSGERIESGQPILTFFVRGKNFDSCLEQMRAGALDLDRWLWRQ
jgi:predicted ATP-grasp superfamily ATP-dependent carboligase